MPAYWPSFVHIDAYANDCFPKHRVSAFICVCTPLLTATLGWNQWTDQPSPDPWRYLFYSVHCKPISWISDRFQCCLLPGTVGGKARCITDFWSRGSVCLISFQRSAKPRAHCIIIALLQGYSSSLCLPYKLRAEPYEWVSIPLPRTQRINRHARKNTPFIDEVMASWRFLYRLYS